MVRDFVGLPRRTHILPLLALRAPLDIHQPDSALPNHMLTTCECRTWHLIGSQTGAPTTFVALLPGDRRDRLLNGT